MVEKIQAIRGMHDILPSETPYWQKIEETCRHIAAQYSYREIRFPIVEMTSLFQRSIGDATDIVSKEMYTFQDRNGDSLTLRPEGTAGCVRAGIEQGLLHNQIQRLFYIGSMFRHERPQKGRTRQFYQFGVEAFGLKNADIDAEMILLSKRIWEKLGISKSIHLEINTLGTLEQRKLYREKLVAYLKAHQHQLDDDSRERLTKNPLRILDSKNPELQSLIAQAPRLIEFVDGEAKAHFDLLCDLLKFFNVSFKINPYLVRGLDYYDFTVFEWITNELGAQGTICAGGRYNGLVEMLGGKSTPAVGFAMGFERVALLLSAQETLSFSPDFYVVSMGSDQVIQSAFLLAEKIRTQFPKVTVEMDADHGNFANQLKRANKSGATFAIMIGESELTENKITLKNLHTGEQQTISEEKLFSFIAERRGKLC